MAENLSEAIREMRRYPNAENNKAFADFIRKMTDENQQVYTTAAKSGSGYAIDTAEHSGNVYCIMYSDSGELQLQKGSYPCTIGISNLIDSVYANPHIAGLVINPHKEPVFMQRKDLQIMSGKEDPRMKHRDWGKGIPQYNQSDIMVAEEALDFAMEIVAEYGLKPGGYHLIEANSSLTAFPNFVAEKDGKVYFIAVEVALAPKMPSLRKEVVPELVRIAAENGNATVYYAPVSISSSDPERMAAGLALVGDEFIGQFPGFLAIEHDE